MDNGRCLYCTTGEALGLRRIVPDRALRPPLDHEQIALVELNSGRFYRLVSPRTRIGRDPRNQIVVENDVFVSRLHAFITFEEGTYWVEDTGSTNGTKLNGSYILEREPLASGDMLTIGQSDFLVQLPASLSDAMPEDLEQALSVPVLEVNLGSSISEIN
ncbi:MAG TPA: FHA domain-containing protein [Candidatus Obscuribacterales bacterium]